MDNKTRFTLHDLPLPAKLVLSAFLMSVGLGYCWALMQLHFKHSSAGNLLPGVTDVVARFSGQNPPWESHDANEQKPGEPPPKSENTDPPRRNQNEPARRGDQPGPAAKNPTPKMVAGVKIKSIIENRCTGCHGEGGEKKDDAPLEKWSDVRKFLEPTPQKGKLLKMISKEPEGWGKEDMTEAFTVKSYVKIGKDEIEWKDMLKQHKEMEATLRLERETERLALKLWIESGAPEEAYEKDAFPLSDELAKRPLTEEFKTQAAEMAKAEKTAKKKRNPKDCQLSVESLTQSTHAHLLTFSLLWAATGLIFAFSSYPLWMRAGIAPLVLIAQVADISCWWLARLPNVGPYFAVAIMGTGAIVGLGLGAQIVLSLFNMYGSKGKVVLLLLFLIGGAAGGVVYAKFIAPQIAAEKEA
jgi:hypothetical protein